MANTQTYKVTLQGKFDSTQITKGISDIKKQFSNIHIGEDLRKQLEQALNKVQVNIPALEKFANKQEFNSKDLEAYQKVIQEVMKDMNSLSKLVGETDFSKFFSEADTSKLKNFEKQIGEVENRLKSTKQEIINAFENSDSGKINGKNNKSLSGVINQLIDVPPDQIENRLNEIVSEAEKQTENAVENFQNILAKSNKVKTGADLTNFLFGKDSGVEIAHGATTRLKDAFNGIREAILSFDQDTPIEDVQAHIQALLELVNDEAFLNTEGKESVLSNFLPPEVLERLKEFQQDIPALKQILGEEKLKLLAEGEEEKLRLTQEQAKFLNDRLQELVMTKQLTAQQAEAVSKALGNMNAQAEDAAHNLKNMEAQSAALEKTFGSLAHRIANSISALTIFNKGTQIVRNAINSVKELDAAFTQIAIVSEQTNEQAWAMFDSFNRLAKQYSITTKDLTEGAKLFYQQGLSAADTMKMVEASTVSAALGEVTMTEAANTLTAAIQGYNESAAVAMDYTDKIAKVGAVSAADFNELSAAMEKTASSAYTAGIDFDHLLGFLGRMIEVTREAPANLGTAMKTIIARFEDMKKDPMAILEDGVSANKVEAALATIGIALRDTAGEFRPLQDVMVELGSQWDSLTRNQQAYIATVAAGSRQQSRFLAMMNDFDRTLELIQESQNSAGAAAEQYAIYQDSAAAATARLTAAWEEFYSKIVNSEQIIWVINALEKLVETMSKIGPVATAIGTTIGALGLNLLGKAIIPNITQGLATVATTGEAASLSIGAIVKGGGALLLTFGKAIFIIGAITAAIYGLVKAGQWIYNQFHQNEIQIKELSNSIEELNNKINDSDKKINSLENLMNKYDELTQKVYLTKEEHEELNNVINQINENSKRAVITLDKNGDAHLENAKSIREEIDAEKEYIEMNAKLAYSKKNELLSKGFKNITEEQAQQVGLDKLVQYKNIIGDETLSDYQKYKGFSQQLDGSSANITGEFQKFYQDNLNSVNKLNKEYFDETYETSKSLIDTLTDVRNKALLEAEQKAAAEGKTITDDEIFDKQQEAVNDYALRLVQTVYGNLDDLTNYTNDEYTHQIEQEINNEVLTDYYNQMALVNEQYKVLTDLFEKSGMTAEEFKIALGNENDFFENYTKAIEEYINSDKNEEDVKKLANAISNSKEIIANSLIEWVNEAIKQNYTNLQQRIQFLGENLDYLSFLSNEQKSDFQNNDKITNKDLNYIETFSKLKISDSSKISLFDFIVQDENDKFQKLAQEYIDSLSNGFSDNTLQLQDQIISVLTNINIPDEDIQRIVNDFVPTYKELLEQRIDEDFGNYNNTRKGINDLTKLKNKERKQFLSENENADKYFEYNEDGEEYLNILGKIVLLEQQREKIESEINSEIIANNAELSDNEKEIKRIKDLGDLASDTEKTNLITLQEKNKELREANSLYEKQLTYINQSSNLQEYESMALQSNLDRAKKASDNIATIGKVWAEYQTSSSDSYIDLMNSLNALDSSYQSLFATVDDKGNQTLTLNQEIVDQMIAGEKDKYEAWRTGEIKRLQSDMVIAQQRADILQHYLDTKGTEEEFAAKEAVIQAVKEANGENDAASNGYEKGLINNANFYNEMSKQAKQYFEQVTEWAQVVYANIANPDNINLKPIETIDAGDFKATGKVKFEDIDISEDDEEEFIRQVEEALANLKYQISIDEATIAKLGDLSPEFKKSYDKAIADAIKGGSKEAEKAAKNLQKAIDDLLDSLEDLDKLLIEIKRDLKDISVDYNPFTDLFEAWEHEWDYYYNIKRLIAQIGTQGQLIDNLANAEYASADQRIQADHAKMGNILANMGANDTYITSLRAGLAQRANEIMEKYGDYYKINPDNMQIYQTDSNLMDINNAINQTGQEIYDLQKLQNEKENNLNLEQAKLDALEQEKSAYEEILSTIDSQIDSLKDNEDITIDLSELQNQKAELEAKIKVSDDSIDEAKQTIRNMEDEIQEIEVNITLKGQVKQQMEDFVGDVEEAGDAYVEMWNTLYETVGNQQELLSQLYDVYRSYYDAALETQQNLYDAIVENYQKEIDQKKRQYDYLKQLDQDYLNSIKNNISKERQIREDAAKQRSYQQSLQRAQLLQMDTSGTFRNDLANLNKEIANQRQELYDDLVDKQVDALEKEVEKRHELYDKEVAALEERLAYMQENAILLWAMVNDIVSQGSEAMMQTLEGTAQYLNANELQRQDARNTWELNVKRTFEGVNEGYIISVSSIIAAGNQFIEAYPELKTAVDDYAGVFESAKKAIDDYNTSLSTGTGKTNQIFEDAGVVFGQIITDFMESWHNSTSSLTGYTGTWEEVIGKLKDSIDQHMQDLEGYYTSEGTAISDSLGSISDFQEEIEGISSEMYDDFIEQRRQYRDELNGVIESIRIEIEAAIQGAAKAIQDAADSITFNAPVPSYSSDGGGGPAYTPTDTDKTGGSIEPTKKYSANVVGTLTDNTTGKSKTLEKDFSNLDSQMAIVRAANDWINEEIKKFSNELADTYERPPYHNKKPNIQRGLKYNYYKQGGLADFTGPAWLDGTKSQPERILSPRQTRLFESMVSSLEKASNNSTINSALGSSYNIGDINTNINVEKLDNETDIDKVARQVENRIMKSIRNRVSVAIA